MKFTHSDCLLCLKFCYPKSDQLDFADIQAPNLSHAIKEFPQVTIYFASKSSLSALIGAGTVSCVIVQACVMILLYEAWHGMLDQARM